MGRPGQQAVARRDPGELERSWRRSVVKVEAGR